MESIVISLGGSIVQSENIDKYYFKKLKNILEKNSKKFKIYIVVGGGKTARNYIKYGRKLGLDEEKLDLIGISVTILNAKIISYLLDIKNEKIPETTDEAKKIDKPIVIMGGTTPGHSTDMVGAELAEKTFSKKLIIATNVDGIYDKDPNIFKNAKHIKTISIDKLINLLDTDWKKAGKNTVIDGPALLIIKRSKIKTFVVNGKNINELENTIFGRSIKGSIIES